ncbi:MAG: TonB-dependent receptor [Bacteroidaceae bacterium]|nr:TonB-dependent receptor [Bacteroidaceae bacterium]
METKKCTRLRFFALGVAFWCFCLVALAQSVNVKGTVVDSHGESIIGASVVQKGNPSVGTVSDLEGNFQLKITGKNPVIVVSYVGMRATEVKVVPGKPVKVTLEEDNAALEEVVVVGYGQQKKASLVGSITQTSGKVLERTGGVSDLGSALTGNLPGVITTSSTGMPGNEKVNIVIRGVSSWNGSDPLVLVDGIERAMEDVDIQSVANISVLKDASATAVYGVKGANGVILITTKRGTEGKARIGFGFSSTMKFVSKLPQTLNSAASLRARNQAIKHELGLSPESWENINSTDFISNYEAPAGSIDPETGFLMSERYPDVDWQKELFKDMAMAYNANVNISGGTRFVKYFASIDFQHEGDLFREWDNGRGYKGGYGFNRVNVRSNLDFQLTKTTTLKANIFGSQGIRNTPWGIADDAWAATQLWQAAYSAPHNAFVPRYSDGTWGYFPQDDQGAPNSVTNMCLAGAEQKITTTVNSDFSLSQDLSFITKGLSVSGTISWDNSFYEEKRGVNDLYHDAQYKWIDPKTGEVRYRKTASPHTKFDFTETRAWSTQGSEIQNWKTYRKLFYQVQLAWARKFGKHDEHDVSAMGVFNRQEHGNGQDFLRYREDWAFRATYNYGDRYLLEYNGAYNGSEQFGPGYRFAFNNSAAVGWTLSNEKFMKPVVNYELFGKKLIDILKFRYSYGEVGNDNLGYKVRFMYDTQWAYGGSTHIDPKDPDNQKDLYTWFREKQVGNPNIRWESAKKRNFGIDYAFLDGFLAGSLEFFHENRYDILLNGSDRSVPFYYGATAPAMNYGRTKTTGYELELRLKHTFKNGIYAYGNFSMTHAANKVQVYDDPELYPSYKKQAGYAIGQASSYLDNGQAQSWDDVIAMTEHDTGDNQKLPGQFIITDFDGNGVINSDDRVPYAYTGTPQNTYNATFGVEYKGWSLMLQFYGATNVSRYVGFNSLNNHLDVVFDEGSFWSAETGAGIPTPRWSSKPSYYEGTRFMYDASFCRLKNMEISYTWTKGWVKSLGLNNLKLYVNGNNLLLWTKMPDDRESNFAATGLASQGAYPTMKRINFGVKFEL